MPAPVILFVYNRPEHTLRTLQALNASNLAQETLLYVFADGAPQDANEALQAAVQQTRDVVSAQSWCKAVIIKESEHNLGLANSVIQGITEVFTKHDQAIVLEDDIVVGKHFLEFVNAGLTTYQEVPEVYGISGYTFPSSQEIQEATFFLPVMSSWGYGIWKDRWERIDFDAQRLLHTVDEKGIGDRLDFSNINYYQMLKDNVQGKNNSWAVRFYVSMYLNNGVFLYPKTSLLQNIGLDGSGVHCADERGQEQVSLESINHAFPVVAMKPVVDANILKGYMQKTKPAPKSAKKGLKALVPKSIKNRIKRLQARSKEAKKQRMLEKTPRYTAMEVVLSGKKIRVPDYASFSFMYDEIYEEGIYKFKTLSPVPYIIDGGANIGLATLYLKELYPTAEIVAFEPDPAIFKYLDANIQAFGYNGITALNKGLWKEDTTLHFTSEGADAGLVGEAATSNTSIEVVSLKKFLNKKVDFLKLDIEGSETVVLEDIADHLGEVDRIFVEYHSFVGEAQSLDRILAILKKADFRYYINAPGIASKVPFQYIRTYQNMDLQLNIYGIKNHIV